MKKDIIQFPKNDKKEFSFNLNIIEKNINTKEYSYFGLGSPNDNDKMRFINQLKEKNLIKNRRFSVLFRENSINDDMQFDGQILFGLLPHNLTIRYDENKLYWTSISNPNKWEIKFDSINYHQEEESFKVKDVEFDITLNLIIGPEEYRQKILNNFLSKLITDKQCKEEIFYNKKDGQFYIAYVFEHDSDIDNIPTLTFYSKDLKESFVLNSEQLLCMYKGKVYLRVIFKNNKENKKWILGRTFMEIFPLIFDVDNSKIGYYKIKKSEDHPVIVFLILGVIAIISGWGIYKGNKYEKEKEKELSNNKKSDNIKRKNE